jgi:multidrug efflux pump
MILVTIATVIVTVVLYIVIPKGFFPQQDTGRLTGGIVADQDTSAQSMAKLMAQLSAGVSSDPDVANVVAFSSASNSGRMFAALKPLGVRKMTVDQVIGRLRVKLARVPGATLYLQAVQDLRIGGRQSNAQYQYTIAADELKDLTHWGNLLLRKMATLPGLADVNSDAQNKGLEASLVIDRATASRLGVTAQAIDNTLYEAFGQSLASTMYTPLNQYYVVLEVAPEFWQNPDSLKYIYCKGTSGLVPLSAFTRFVADNTPLVVNHSSQFPSVTISFNLLPGVSLGNAVEEIQDAEREMGVPATVHGSFSGTAQAYQDSLGNEPILIAAALIAVYIVLGMLYESFVHPVTILSTLPSAGVGALLALILCHTDLSVIALIGIILLIGIVKKNAIMMIDFALEAERNDGKTPKEAIFQACLLRFRPIMMTTAAALLGGLPLAIGGGTGAELRQPLGIAIVGGLIFSQMLTLYTTPVIYLYLDTFRLWWGSLWAPTADEAERRHGHVPMPSVAPVG